MSTLGLMASDGVGELDLKGIVVTVGLEFLEAVGLDCYVGIVLEHGVVELFLLLTGECRCL